jgi:hypothetical protein
LKKRTDSHENRFLKFLLSKYRLRYCAVMRRLGLNDVVWGGLLFLAGPAMAQSSLDVLEQDLNQVKQEHQEAASQIITAFISQLDAASQSPDAAANLYEAAGGTLPAATPVSSANAYETPDEKAARQAQDQANLASFGYVLQLHCGLMRFAGLFVVHPDQKGLHEEWIAWLKTAAEVYPTLNPGQDAKSGTPRGAGARGARSGGGRAAWGGGLGYRDVAVRDSIISAYLGFHGWGEKEEGQWRVLDLPKLYRANILDPLRATPSADTLAAWDTYIAMKSSEESDRDRWDEIDYPALEFERGSDDFVSARSTEKLAILVALLKANSTHPQIDDWIARVHRMVQDLRNQKAGKAPSAPPAAPATSDDPAPVSPAATKS